MRIAPPNNTALPELPVWQARSFWVQLLALAAVALNVVGIDLYAVTCEMGLGCDAAAVQATGDSVVAAWQMVLPFVLGIWAWAERRAPRYRLMWPWHRASGTAVVLAAGLFLLPPDPAQAAQCGPRDQVTKLLADRYGETRQGLGVGANHTVMEVWASAATGTWTITVSDAGGLTCLVASGEGFQALAENLPAEGDPT
jgi:hypothetical protein